MNDKGKEKGMVLVLVVIFGAILIMSGTALLTTGVVEVRSGNYFEDDTQAYFIAKSAADMLAHQIINQSVNIDSYPATFSGNIQGNTYAINVTKEESIITINSTGFSDGVDDVVKLLIRETASSVNSTIKKFLLESDMAIFSNNSISLSGGGIVNGDIGTNSTSNGGVSLSGGASINGEIFVGKGGDPETVVSVPNWMTRPDIYVLTEIITYEEPVMPDIPTNYVLPENDVINYGHNNSFVAGIKNGELKVSGSIDYLYDMSANNETTVYFDAISLQSDRTLTINIGDQDRNIIVDKLNASNGDIYINGEGNLTIYIKDRFSFGSSFINWTTVKNPEKLFIVYYGNKAVSFNSDSRFCGLFLSDDAKLTLSGGGSFYGSIISNTEQNISISGGHSAYTNFIYAPRARISVSGGGAFSGTLIGNEASVSGGGSVSYNKLNEGLIEFIIEETTSSSGSTTYEELYYK